MLRSRCWPNRSPRRTEDDRAITPAWSHTVFVCPVFECNARTERSEVRQQWDCVNGHRLNYEDLYRGRVRPVYQAAIMAG
jgi:hypothetical protein